MLMLDVLHVLDHGVAQHLFAGILHSLVFKQLRGSPQRNLADIWGRMQELYNDGRTEEKLSRLTMKMFVDIKSPNADFPKLSNAIKVQLSLWTAVGQGTFTPHTLARVLAHCLNGQTSRPAACPLGVLHQVA